MLTKIKFFTLTSYLRSLIAQHDRSNKLYYKRKYSLPQYKHYTTGNNLLSKWEIVEERFRNERFS
ncbi:hypothetical protein HQ36_00475 [Porphyromonas gingivicanis]|uniref:Uncharacterized protein n=1 Tax=Porphyromonas gingivicanis TaxID=266762 RepID=A0A0A2G9C6_9PORP|nr:hypothetical protein [Porphyromonas gingivicanis]KGN98995.1 hypothetical protein HQ36_00475 [Porphyromonas gingivicanis]